MGSVRGRPFCIPTNKTIAQTCQLDARPNGNLHGCFLTGLGANTRVCFSPIRFNRPLCTTDEVSESRSVLVALVWPTQPWYPLLLQMCVEPPLLFPMFPQLLTKGSIKRAEHIGPSMFIGLPYPQCFQALFPARLILTH